MQIANYSLRKDKTFFGELFKRRNEFINCFSDVLDRLDIENIYKSPMEYFSTLILSYTSNELRQDQTFIKYLLLNGYATPDILEKTLKLDKLFIKQCARQFEKLIGTAHQKSSCFFPNLEAVEHALRAEEVFKEEKSEGGNSLCNVYFKFK